MANVLYDFRFGWPVFPYLGIGIGGQVVRQVGISAQVPGNPLPPSAFTATQSTSAVAYQGIVGVALPISAVPGLSLTLDYRFLGMVDPFPGFKRGFLFSDGTILRGTDRFSDNYNHSIIFGLRYALYQPSSPPAGIVAPARPPEPVVDRAYIVFFDWDSANLTNRGHQIIREASQRTSGLKVTRIMVNGYIDLSGTPRYNEALSVRRARVVAGELIRDGIPENEITIRGFGENHPLVPTEQGVREPQNRRVEIILQ